MEYLYEKSFGLIWFLFAQQKYVKNFFYENFIVKYIVLTMCMCVCDTLKKSGKESRPDQKWYLKLYFLCHPNS